ncbi:MAG TPA: hypothetical protein VEY30_09580 [Myxococcaceae bacterium]|nr:hypothetical protein [Myxococcaceae bacterium]
MNRPSLDLRPLDALMSTLLAVLSVLLLALVLFALFPRQPPAPVMKMLAFLVLVFGGVTGAVHRARGQLLKAWPSPRRMGRTSTGTRHTAA